MSRLIIFGATGSLGSHVVRMAVAAGQQVTVFVRTPSKLPLEAQAHVSVHQGDLSTLAIADIAELGGDTFARHRVGLALPPGMRGKKTE